MTLPTDDLGWVNYLARRHDAEKPELERYDAYYEGRQGLTYMHPEIFREVQDRIAPVIIAWPKLIVDSVDERLDVEGFRLPDERDEDKDFWRVWQANDLDEESQLAHIDALVMRRSYITVGANEDDDDTPLVTVESPLEVYADIDPRTRKVRAALRRYNEENTTARAVGRFATLYLPARTVFYKWSGGWVEEDRDEHKFGEVPVVPLVNRKRLTTSNQRRSGANTLIVRFGVSELDAVIPLSDAANKLATDMMLAAEFVALPLRGFWGIGPDDLIDEKGNKLTALQAIMGRLLTLKETDGKQFQFDAASLGNFHESLNQLAKMVASLAGLPPHYLGFTTDNPASADAIRSAEARLIKRAERKQRAFGGAYEQAMRLVRRFQAGEGVDKRLAQLEVVWRDPSTPTVAQAADAAVKKFQAEIITLRQVREDLGYTDAQIKRMEAEDETARANDPLAEIARGLTQQTAPAPNGQPGPEPALA